MLKSFNGEKRSALPASNCDRKRLSEQLALRQGIESRALERTLAAERTAIQPQRSMAGGDDLDDHWQKIYFFLRAVP